MTMFENLTREVRRVENNTRAKKVIRTVDGYIDEGLNDALLLMEVERGTRTGNVITIQHKTDMRLRLEYQKFSRLTTAINNARRARRR